MSTARDYVEYACEQIAGTGAVRFRKMFGEYVVYVDDKPLLLVCDNTVFVKILPCLEPLLADAEQGLPFPGARPHYVLDIDNPPLARAVVAALLPVIPLPRPKKKKAPLFAPATPTPPKAR